jgi:SAM-dependent methyltransferase
MNTQSTTNGHGDTREEIASYYLTHYLRRAPLAAALWRSAEAAAIEGVDLARPILDIGCAFGEFGRVFFEGRPRPEIGIDIDRRELRRATADPIYGSVAQVDARCLPFATACLPAVISISTLEHIPDVETVLNEIGRVLRPGGVLAYTVPIEPLNENLALHRVLRTIGLRGLADSYARTVHRGLTHVNIWPASRWVTSTRDAGMDVLDCRPILAPRATMAFEILLPAALASRAWRNLTGKRPPHPAFIVRAVERVFRGLVLEESDRGSNLLIVARRQA